MTVAKEIELEDPFENMGAQLVREVASKTNDVAGDGTTTATVLAAGHLPRRRDATWPPAANPIAHQSAASTKAVGRRGGRSSSNISQARPTIQQGGGPGRLPFPPTGTLTIGNIIAEAMDKVGKDGTITVEEAKGIETTLDVVEGMQFDKRLPVPLLRDQRGNDGKRFWKTPTS